MRPTKRKHRYWSFNDLQKHWAVLISGATKRRALTDSAHVYNQHSWVTDDTLFLTVRDYVRCYRVKSGSPPARELQ